MIPVISIIGQQENDVRSISSRLVEQLRRQGYSVATVQAATGDHRHASLVFKRAGAEELNKENKNIRLVSDLMTMHIQENTTNICQLVSRHFPDSDIVIAEGFATDHHIPKVALTSDSCPLEHFTRMNIKRIIQTIPEKHAAGVATSDLNKCRELADFIEQRFLVNNAKEQTILFINGKKIALNSFIQQILSGTVLGFTDTLKKTEGAKRIDLLIRIGEEQEEAGRLSQDGNRHGKDSCSACTRLSKPRAGRDRQ
jgi:molybdopterin-guanine dinucleotide biosynthesis protein MobB